MLIPVGLILVLGLVFGGFALSGGKFDVIFHALPYEGMMIAGASLGALVIMSDASSLKMIAKALKRAFAGPRWKSSDYRDLLMLLYELTRLQRSQGATGLEPHIEEPETSTIFKKYPRILKDSSMVSLITDGFRMITLNFDNPHQMEDVLEKRIETTLEEREIPGGHLTTVADALPAIGIVAAVLGVIKTMSSVDQPPEILGSMIGGAPGRHLPWGVPGLLRGAANCRARQIDRGSRFRIFEGDPGCGGGCDTAAQPPDLRGDRPREHSRADAPELQ